MRVPRWKVWASHKRSPQFLSSESLQLGENLEKLTFAKNPASGYTNRKPNLFSFMGLILLSHMGHATNLIMMQSQNKRYSTKESYIRSRTLIE